MKTTAIQFDASKEERRKISRIALRAKALGDERPFQDIQMDIEATHCNGCLLDLPKLLSFDDFNFLHDVYGIAKHLNRETGEIEGHFLPRCAM